MQLDVYHTGRAIGSFRDWQIQSRHLGPESDHLVITIIQESGPNPTIKATLHSEDVEALKKCIADFEKRISKTKTNE